MTAEESYAVAARWEDFKTERVYPRYVKMYADGGPNTHTVYLLDDYSDRPGSKGQMSLPTEQFIDDFSHFNSMGLGMIVHTWGDATSVEIVKAFEAVRERNGDNGVPLHFSHSFMIRPQEIERLSKISDVCMDFMTLQYPHPAIEDTFVESIGEERYQRWLNVRSAAEIGIPFAFGTDWPATVEPVLNGFFQMQGFVTRRDPRDPDHGTLNADQAITLEQAVWGFTQGGAECLGFDWPQELGSIEEGKLADFIVIDRNIFEIPIEEVHETSVDLTVVGGEVVFNRTEAVEDLDVVTFEITNADLRNAVDAAELNLLVEDELGGGGHGCFAHDHEIGPGARLATEDINEAFASLSDKGHRFARPARTVYWKNTDSTYWIQWTIKDDAAFLWAYDPETSGVVEVLQVRD